MDRRRDPTKVGQFLFTRWSETLIMQDYIDTVLLTPAWSRINFDPRVSNDPASIQAKLSSIATVCEGERSVDGFLLNAGENGSSRFSNLDKDARSTFSDPVFRVIFNASELTRSETDREWLRIETVTLWIFDNSVTISEVTARIYPALVPDEMSCAELEDHFTAFSADLFKSVFYPMLDRIHRQLDHVDRDARMPVAKATPFSLARRKSALWTNRTYCIRDDADERARELTRYQAVTGHGERVSGTAYVHAGNNIVCDKSTLEEFVKALLVCQYIYVVLEFILDEQQAISSAAQSRPRHGAINLLRERTDHLNDIADLVEIETFRLQSTLQSFRLLVFSAAYRCYNYTTISRSVKIRFNILSRDINRAVQRDQSWYLSVTRYALILISLLQFISTTSDVFNLARDFGLRPRAGTYGILSVASYVSFNSAVNIIGLLLLVAATIGVWRSEHFAERR